MLSNPSLLLAPWQQDITSAPEVRCWSRAIRHPQSGATLGQVQCMERPSIWCLRRPTFLDVLETDDRSLVMSVRESWLWPETWFVVDCDGSRVGSLRENVLLDPWGKPFAERILHPPATWVMRELHGRDYAYGEYLSEGDRVTFAEPVLTNPFLRMLILGSFLLLRAKVK